MRWWNSGFGNADTCYCWCIWRNLKQQLGSNLLYLSSTILLWRQHYFFLSLYKSALHPIIWQHRHGSRSRVSGRKKGKKGEAVEIYCGHHFEATCTGKGNIWESCRVALGSFVILLIIWKWVWFHNVTPKASKSTRFHRWPRKTAGVFLWDHFSPACCLHLHSNLLFHVLSLQCISLGD